MDTVKIGKDTFLKLVEKSFGVLVRTDEEFVLALLKGKTYNRFVRDENLRWEERVEWVYEHELEGPAIAFGITEQRLKEILGSLEKGGKIIRGTDIDAQGPHFPKCAYVTNRMRRRIQATVDRRKT